MAAFFRNEVATSTAMAIIRRFYLMKSLKRNDHSVSQSTHQLYVNLWHRCVGPQVFLFQSCCSVCKLPGTRTYVVLRAKSKPCSEI
jgi:hypothetical protein